MKILVFEELRKTKVNVGALSRETGQYCFTYAANYLNRPQATAIGPDLPLSLKVIRSKDFFKSLDDLLPDRRNPAYNMYCKKAGILPQETDKLKLLTSIGKRGPSKFVFEEFHDEVILKAQEIKNFRKKLMLSQRDFALFFDIPLISFQQLEKNVSSQKITRRFLRMFISHNHLLKDQIKERGYLLHAKKLKTVIESLGKKNILDYMATVYAQRTFIKSEIKNLQGVRSNVDKLRALASQEPFEAIVSLGFDHSLIVAGMLNELLRGLGDLLYKEITLTPEIERFSRDYKRLRPLRNLLVHGYKVEDFDLEKGMKANLAAKRIKSIVNNARSYFAREMNIDRFLSLMGKILEQIDPIMEQIRKEVVWRGGKLEIISDLDAERWV